MAHTIKITFDLHALVRARERGTNEDEIRNTVLFGERFPAKKGRSGFRQIIVYEAEWEGVFYRHKQVEVFAAPGDNEWTVITVITKYF